MPVKRIIPATTKGDSTHVPVVTVDSHGQVVSLTDVLVSGGAAVDTADILIADLASPPMGVRYVDGVGNASGTAYLKHLEGASFTGGVTAGNVSPAGNEVRASGDIYAQIFGARIQLGAIGPGATAGIAAGTGGGSDTTQYRKAAGKWKSAGHEIAQIETPDITALSLGQPPMGVTYVNIVHEAALFVGDGAFGATPADTGWGVFTNRVVAGYGTAGRTDIGAVGPAAEGGIRPGNSADARIYRSGVGKLTVEHTLIVQQRVDTPDVIVNNLGGPPMGVRRLITGATVGNSTTIPVLTVESDGSVSAVSSVAAAGGGASDLSTILTANLAAPPMGVSYIEIIGTASGISYIRKLEGLIIGGGISSGNISPATGEVRATGEVYAQMFGNRVEMGSIGPGSAAGIAAGTGGGTDATLYRKAAGKWKTAAIEVGQFETPDVTALSLAAPPMGVRRLIASGTTGDATHVAQITVQADGSLSAVASVAITGLAESDITNLVSDLGLKAPLASPTFTGNVTIPSLRTPDIIVNNLGDARPGVVPALVTYNRSADSQTTSVADANYTAVATDRLIIYTTLTATRTVTLPAASSMSAGTRLRVQDGSGGPTWQTVPSVEILIARAGADTIHNGSVSASISIAYGYCELVTDGTSKWFITDQTENIQAWTANGSFTWTKRPGYRMFRVRVFGAGGGGGSGRRGTGNAASGGGAGAAGGVSENVFEATNLGATESVVVGAGGAGGTAISVNATNGNVGTGGGASRFGTATTGTVFVAPTASAAGGTAGIATAAAASAATNAENGLTTPGGVASVLTGAGNAAQNSSATLPSNSFHKLSPGGGGGSSGGSGLAAGGGKGGGSNAAAPNTQAAGGATAGSNGGAGNDMNLYMVGGGGGGGGAGGAGTNDASGPGGTGGAGGKPGGGGGGGGGTVDNAFSKNSGAGGAGADGAVYVIGTH